jgi:hypothetical protein
MGKTLMNGLEALEEIKCDMEYVTRLDFVEPIVRGEVRDKLKKIYWRELDQLDRIEKELKAFEIIKDKKVETYHLSRCKTLIEYNSAWDIGGMDLTQDEFDLLKEVLK